MKTIIFVCFVVFFTSCSKDKINLSGSGWDSWDDWSLYNIKEDSSNIVKADIDSAGTIYRLSAVGFNTLFSRYVVNSDTNFILVHGAKGDIGLELDLSNIKTTGTYKFGHNTSPEVNASCSFGSVSYLNDYNILSGSLTIDTLTARHIHGLFSVKCWNGIKAVNITNGSFSGNY